MSDQPDGPADSGAVAGAPAGTGASAGPGWYHDAQGTVRWWNGTQWSQAAPADAGSAAGAFNQPAAQAYGVAPTLDAGTALSYGWKKFQEHAAPFLGMVAVVALVSLAAFVLPFFALIPATSNDTTSATIGWILFTVAVLIAMAIAYVLQAGILRAGLAVTRGTAPSLSMLVERTNLGTYVGTTLLVTLAVWVGMILCILPGIAVMVLAVYAPLIALDTGAGPVESIRRSVDLVKDNLGPVLVVLLLSYAVQYLGSLACYVGVVVSIPVALVMLTYSYRVLTNEPVAA